MVVFQKFEGRITYWLFRLSQIGSLITVTLWAWGKVDFLIPPFLLNCDQPKLGGTCPPPPTHPPVFTALSKYAKSQSVALCLFSNVYCATIGLLNHATFIPQKQKRPLKASMMSEAENNYLRTWIIMSLNFCKSRFS